MLLNVLWPNIHTEKGRKTAILYGTISLFAVTLAMMYRALAEIFPELRSESDIDREVIERVSGFIVHVSIMIVSGALALRLWRTKSLAIAAIALILRALDAVYVLQDESSVRFAIWFLMLLFSIHGVRGAQGMRLHTEELRKTPRLIVSDPPEKQ
jgi:hypothetical protein